MFAGLVYSQVEAGRCLAGNHHQGFTLVVHKLCLKITKKEKRTNTHNYTKKEETTQTKTQICQNNNIVSIVEIDNFG